MLRKKCAEPSGSAAASGGGTIRAYVNDVLLSPQDDGKYHFTLTGDTTLRITLTPTEPTYIVSYSPNGGHDAPLDRGSYKNGDTVSVASGAGMTRTGCTFTGWNTQADGDGDAYAAGGSLAMGSADLVLYAQWAPMENYTVTYDANGGDKPAAAVTITTPADSEGKFPGDTLVEFTAMAGSGSVLSSLTASVNGTIVELTAADPDEAGVSERLDTGAHEKYLTGYPDGDFRPDSTITRAEAAAVVNRMLARSGDENYIRTRLEALTRFGDLTADHWAYFEIMEAANGHAYDRLDGREYWKKP